MTLSSETLGDLEGLFVREFRLCQALHCLAREEMHALAIGDAPGLLALATRKQTIWDQLRQVGQTRETTLKEIEMRQGTAASQLGWAASSGAVSAFPPQVTGFFNHLQEGILVLKAQVREQARRNCALAGQALSRADALQAYLSGISQYSPTGPETVPITASDAIEHGTASSLKDIDPQTALPDLILAAAAREALAAHNYPTASSLQKALDHFAADLSEERGAYQAVLRSSAQILVGA